MKVVDPVCKMMIDSEKAAATSEHKGQTIYFCAKGCKAKFDEGPGEVPWKIGGPCCSREMQDPPRPTTRVTAVQNSLKPGLTAKPRQRRRNLAECGRLCETMKYFHH